LLRIVGGSCFVVCLGCSDGQSSPNPVAPAPSPTPVATPAPVTFTLDAPGDHYMFSRRLQELPVGRSLDVSLEPLEVHAEPSDRSAHTVEVWLWPEAANGQNFTDHGVAVSFGWLEDSTWFPASFKPHEYWHYPPGRVTMALGTERTVRVIRHREGLTEFTLDGARVAVLPDPGGTCHVLARVVGTLARFTYVPFDASVSDSEMAGTVAPCGTCAR
jgi:hypothetical protein